jgi:5-methyltetrahydrofolate--homocysteine methyltransferase
MTSGPVPIAELEKIKEGVIAGDMSLVAGLTENALAGGGDPKVIMDEALIPAMSVVGEKFEKKEYFVAEVLISARAMEASLVLLRPLLEAAKVEPIGRVAVGTVAGDLHDIGKNIVGMVLTGAGMSVENLGVDVSPEAFVEAVERGVDVIGMSSLLTTTRTNMSRVVSLLQERGLRDRVKVVIGGAAVTEKFASEIGADGYGTDANDAVKVVKRLMGI